MIETTALQEHRTRLTGLLFYHLKPAPGGLLCFLPDNEYVTRIILKTFPKLPATVSPLGCPQAIADANGKNKPVVKSLSTKGAQATRQGNALFLKPVRKNALKWHEPFYTSEIKFKR